MLLPAAQAFLSKLQPHPSYCSFVGTSGHPLLPPSPIEKPSTYLKEKNTRIRKVIAVMIATENTSAIGVYDKAELGLTYVQYSTICTVLEKHKNCDIERRGGTSFFHLITSDEKLICAD